jgi:tetratricopeptide (TPR) repeat protein
MLFDRLQNIYQLYQNKASVDAEIGVRALLKDYPNNSDVLRLGALTALSLNQVVTAKSRLFKAMELCSLTAEMANSLGNILKAAGDWSQAEEAYKKAIVLDGAYEPVRSNVIDLLIKSGQIERAHAEIKRQSDVYGDSDFLFFARATVLLELGQYDKALGHIDQISEAYSSAKIAALKLRLFFHLREFDKMKIAFDAIPLESEDAVESLALMINGYAMQDDWMGAREIIKTIIENPKAPPPLFVKASDLLRRGGFESEADALRIQTGSRFEGHVDILTQNAAAEFDAERYQESSDIYAQALALRPGNYNIMTGYARACLAAGQFDLCQQLIRGAFQQTPNSQFLYALAATLQRKRGQPYKGLYDYEVFIQSYDLGPPPGYASIDEFNQALKACLKRQHCFKSEPLNQSLRQGTQTDQDLFLVDEPVLRSFFDLLEDPITQYMQKIGFDSQHPFKRRNTGRYRINGAWSVQLFPHGHHVNHVHPMGWISSSYYVDVPDVAKDQEEKQGWIKFGEPDIPSLNLSPEKYIEPKGGRLVLFPSYMWHGTIPFTGQQRRLTLPFDVLPV